MNRLKSLSVALLAPLVLLGCVLAPGKFVSTLDIHTDRSFTYTYKGEVIGIDLANEFAKGMAGKAKGDDDDNGDGDDGDDSSGGGTSPSSLQIRAAAQKIDPQPAPDDDASSDEKFKAMAAALAKEPGFRSVVYKGNGVFDIDYSITGSLTHTFLWPYNLDAEVIFPFVVIELRGDSNVRVKAPGFAKEDNGAPGGGGGGKAASKMDGVFTLTTDAEIVSQNNEDGAKTLPDGRRSISWKATPLTKDAPSAVLKLQPLGH